MSDGKQAALAAIQQINAVEGFDPRRWQLSIQTSIPKKSGSN